MSRKVTASFEVGDPARLPAVMRAITDLTRMGMESGYGIAIEITDKLRTDWINVHVERGPAIAPSPIYSPPAPE